MGESIINTKIDFFKHIVFSVIITIFLIIFICDFFFWFNNITTSNTRKILNNYVKQKIEKIHMNIEDVSSSLHILGLSLSQEEFNPSFEFPEELLSSIKEIEVIKNIFLYTKEKISKTFSEEEKNKLLKGDALISQMTDKYQKNKTNLIIAEPVLKNNKVEGAVVISIPPELLTGMVKSQATEKTIYSIIIDKNGRSISENSYFDNIFGRKEFKNNLSNIKNDISENKTGFFTFFYNNEKYYFHYSPLNLNNWYNLEIIPYNSINTSAEHIKYVAYILVIKIILIFIIVMFITNFIHKRDIKTITKNKQTLESFTDSIPGGVAEISYSENSINLLFSNEGFFEVMNYSKSDYENGKVSLYNFYSEKDKNKIIRNFIGKSKKNKINIELKLKDFNGNPVWINQRGTFIESKDNCNIYHCIFIPVTKEKLALQNFEIEKEKYEIVTSLTNNMIFEYDFKKDIFIYSKSFEEKNIIDFMKNKKIEKFVHPEDYDKIDVLMSNMKTKNIFDSQLRLLNKYEIYKWYQIRAKTIFDENGVPLRTIGRIENIDDAINEKNNLLNLANKDGLTGLYNKKISENLIKELIDKKLLSDNDYLFILDIDSFKAINDTFGHLNGDKAIITLAENLKSLFRNTDIIGRMGGDEFIVLMRDVNNLNHVKEKAEKLCHLICKASKENKEVFEIGCSIGISRYISGMDFYTFFKKADDALYQVKQSGKSNFKISD